MNARANAIDCGGFTAARHLAKRGWAVGQLAELQPWIFFEFGGAGVRGTPVAGCAGPAGGVNIEPAGIFHSACFDEQLAGNLVDKGKHLAAAVWAKATIDMRAVETQ